MMKILKLMENFITYTQKICFSFCLFNVEKYAILEI